MTNQSRVLRTSENEFTLPSEKRMTIMILALTLGLSIWAGGCRYEKDDVTTAVSKPEVAQNIDVNSLQNAGPTTSFYIDLVNAKSYKSNEVISIAAGAGDITVNGWGADSKGKKAAGGVFATVDNATNVPASYGEERKDVANYLKDVNYTNSGFTVKIPTANLKQGRHVISFKVVSADKKEFFTAEQKVQVEVQ